MKHYKATSYFFLFFFVTMAVFVSGIANAEPLDNWHVRNSPVSSTLRSATYGNGMFVAVGDNGTILSSNDGVVWTSRVSGTTTQLNGVTYGNDMFVAVGSPETILTSPDGMIWTTRRTGTTYGLNAVTCGNGTFVTVGSPEVILTSSDGISWTVRKTNVMSHLYAVTYGDGMFLALRDYTSIYRSTDGIVWSLEEINGNSIFYFNNIAYGQGSFILVGGAEYTEFGIPVSVEIIFSSFDGLNWTQRDYGPFALHGATYGNSHFVALGDYGKILSSAGGSHWTARQSGTTQWLYGATYGNGTFVAVGYGGTILQSDPMVTNTDCTAILSSDLGLHVPMIDASGLYLWADFQYEDGGANDIMLKLTNTDFVSNPSDYSSCQASTLSYDTNYKLHVPSINFDNVFYRADLEYAPTGNGQIWFKWTTAEPN